MRHKLLLAAVIAITCLVARNSSAEEAPEFVPPTPGEQHQELLEDVGTWDAAVQMWMTPDAEPLASKAVEKVTAAGGFWVLSEFKGEMMGAPFTGHGLTGYDPVKEKYVGTWVDSMTPHLMNLVGEKDENGEIVMIGTGIDCMTKQEMTCKMIHRKNADGTKTFEMHAPGEDGKWFKVMQIVYTKREAT